MAGEYGIGAGIAQGLDTFNKGMVQAEQIKSNREEQRQQAEFRTRQLGMQEQKLQNDSQVQQIQMQQMSAQLKQMNNALVKEQTYNYMSAFKRTGESKYLTMAYKSNPALQSNFPNINSIDSPLSYSDEVLKTLGADKEVIEADKGRYVVVTDNNGNKALQDMYGLYAMSGVLPMFEQQEQDKMKFSVDLQNSKLQQQLASTQIQGQGLNNVAKQQEITMNQRMLDDPNILLSKDPTKAKAKQELKLASEAQTIDDYIVNDPDKFAETLKASNKNDKIKIGNTEYTAYEVAKIYQANNGADKLDVNFTNELRGKRNVVQGSDRILDMVDKMKEWNLDSKVRSKVESVLGDYWKSASTDKTKNAELGAKAEAELSRLGLEANMFPVIADYIKAMSGAAVSEGERVAYVNNMTAGWMADKTAMKRALGGFRNSVNENFKNSMDTIQLTHPRTYMELKLDNKAKEESKASTTSSGNVAPLGTKAKLQDGTIVVKTENGWEKE